MFQGLSIALATGHDEGRWMFCITWPLPTSLASLPPPWHCFCSLVSPYHCSHIKMQCPSLSATTVKAPPATSSTQKESCCLFISPDTNIIYHPISLHRTSLFTCISGASATLRVSCLRPRVMPALYVTPPSLGT